ncbi:MAG: ABC transporter permease [Thermoproteota archaeon]
MLKASTKLWLGISILSIFVLFTIFGLLFYKVDPKEPKFASLQPPSLENPLGTDILGRDILAQLIHGTAYSLKIGVFAALISSIIGILIGGTGGYLGGVIDDILTLVTNTLLTIPSIALLVVIAAYFRVRSEWVIVLIIGITSWPSMARSIRSQVLSLKSRDFVELAKLLGLSKSRILFVEVLPNMLSYIVMYFFLNIAGAIVSEAALSVIGLGPTAATSLGMLLRWAIAWDSIRCGAWWWFFPPGLAITLLSVSLFLINDGLDQLYNPRAKVREV